MVIGDAIFHPRYGVAIIESIERRLVDGETRDYFVIPKPSISSTIFVPVDMAGELGLRPLSTVEKLKQASSIIYGESDDTGLCSKGHKICWGDPIDLARVIRSCMMQPCPKVAPQNQLNHAKVLLAEELSAVLGVSRESIIALVDKQTKRKPR